MSKAHLIKNLETLYLRSLSADNISSALKTQELFVKYTGVLDVNKIDEIIEKIKMLDDAELGELAGKLELEETLEMVAEEGLEPPTRGL